MNDKDNGGPAFPSQEMKEGIGSTELWEGMSLRDYFAAKAMQGLIQNIDSLDKYFNENCITTGEEMTKKISEISYDFSDSMINTRQDK